MVTLNLLPLPSDEIRRLKRNAKVARYRRNHPERVVAYKRSKTALASGRAASEKWRQENQDKVRDAYLRRKYGIGLSEYNALLEKQAGVCAGCRGQQTRLNNKFFCVDHDHRTKQVRGLLCHSCNTALGCVKDSPSILKQLASYLESN